MIRFVSTFVFLLLLSSTLYSQIYIDGKLFEPTGDMHYIAVDPVFRMQNGERGVEVQVYTALTPRRSSREWLTDASGTRLRFNNWIGMLDYFYRNNWETVSIMYVGDEFDEQWYLLKLKESEK